ncbi:cytochrome P450 [Lentzea alba]|uniref:hypothetical protein n=1 Tax=Lentzea alba TaxID=2714351 RepID=UPI0039BFA20A
MPSTTAERHATFRFLRERSPVHYDADLGGWCITRYDDVRKVLDIDPGHLDPPPRRVSLAAAEAARPAISRRADELIDADDDTFAQSLAVTAAEAFGLPDFTAAALDATRAFLINALQALREHPDQAELLRNDPALAPDAVEELLRFDAPVPIALPRRTHRPVVLSGRTVEAGEVLLPVVGAANRCAVRYPGADRLDLRRKPEGVLVACETSTAIVRVTGEIALVERLKAPAR